MIEQNNALMDLSPATESLLYLLALSTDEQKLAETLPGILDDRWSPILEAAAQHDLRLLLFNRLNNAPAGLTPAWVLEQLQANYLAAAVRNTLMLHHAAEILNSLKSAGLEVIVLKGLYLVENVYANIALRTFGDIDLMVRRDSIADALKVMQHSGYSLSRWYDPAETNTDLKHLPPLEKPDAPTVEIHWTIVEETEPFCVEPQGLWQRAVTAIVAGVGVQALSLEDLLLHLSLHFTYQHRLQAGLRNLFDIAETLRCFGAQVDWQKLVQIAQEWGTERITWLTFRLLREVTGVEVPTEVLQALQPHDGDDLIVAEALAQLFSKVHVELAFTPDLANLPAAGYGGKLRLVMQRIFIPRKVLAREYNVDPASLKIYGYYLVRLRDLWRRYARSGWGAMRGDEDALIAVNLRQANQQLHEWMVERTPPL